MTVNLKNLNTSVDYHHQHGIRSETGISLEIIY